MDVTSDGVYLGSRDIWSLSYGNTPVTIPPTPLTLAGGHSHWAPLLEGVSLHWVSRWIPCSSGRELHLPQSHQTPLTLESGLGQGDDASGRALHYPLSLRCLVAHLGNYTSYNPTKPLLPSREATASANSLPEVLCQEENVCTCMRLANPVPGRGPPCKHACVTWGLGLRVCQQQQQQQSLC